MVKAKSLFDAAQEAYEENKRDPSPENKVKLLEATIKWDQLQLQAVKEDNEFFEKKFPPIPTKEEIKKRLALLEANLAWWLQRETGWKRKRADA